ncbi:MAG: rRNA adenine dimethyltransferase family protein [Candidatus Jorgensenbacteria bacterium]
MGKRLGQHFLESRIYLRRIAGALELEPSDTVVEIGPGHGELTKELIKTPGARFILIERDSLLVASLRKNFQFLPLRGISRMETISSDFVASPRQGRDNSQTNSKPQNSKIEIIEGDVLKILPKLIRNLKLPARRSPHLAARSDSSSETRREAFDEAQVATGGEIRNPNYKIVGNIPFYLTGRLLRVIGDLITNHQSLITRVVLTVQQEVAERIIAKPPKMNLLAASIQLWAAPTIVGYIPRKEFSPPPKVDSAILALDTKVPAYDPAAYYTLVHALFKQPRKTILNNLTAGDPRVARHEVAEKLRGAGMKPEGRPQDLSVEDILSIASLRYT